MKTYYAGNIKLHTQHLNCVCPPRCQCLCVCMCVCVYFSHVACCTTKILVDRPVRSANRVQNDRTQFKRSEYFPSFLSFLFHLSLSRSLLWCKKQSVKNDIINCHFDEGREREERTRKMLHLRSVIIVATYKASTRIDRVQKKDPSRRSEIHCELL